MARHKTIYCGIHARFSVSEKLEVLSELVNPINVTNQTFIMKHRPVLSPQDGESQELQ